MKDKSNYRYFLALLISFSLTLLLNPLVIQTDPSQKFLAPPPEGIEYMHFGFRESLADSLWLRWIQDGDYCQTYLAPVQPVKAILNEEDKLVANPRHRICDQSWGFKMLDAITKLAPAFKMPYEAGAITLSVLVEDYQGASVIFDRAVAQFPNDWILLYRAAYHYLYDRNDYAKAASLLDRAAEAGAPQWVRSLAARLYSRTGQIELGIQALEAYLKTVDKEDARASIEKRIADLKAQLK